MRRGLIILFLLMSILSFSQKVKFKKDKVLLDKVEVFNFLREGKMTTISTLSGVEFLTVLSTSYQKRNEFYNPKYSSSLPYYDYYVYTVRFLKSGKELTTDVGLDNIIRAIKKSEMVDENGNVDEVKIDTFITKYNNENLKYKIH
ncbi:MAG: hypothetical protein QM535_00975 [Limnohabitans sp.]|nr:hypothetical protein [Limnohabitans sp.]